MLTGPASTDLIIRRSPSLASALSPAGPTNLLCDGKRASRGRWQNVHLVSIYSFEFPSPRAQTMRGCIFEESIMACRHVLAKKKTIPQSSVDRLIWPVSADACRVGAEVRSLPIGTCRSHGYAGPRLPRVLVSSCVQRNEDGLGLKLIVFFLFVLHIIRTGSDGQRRGPTRRQFSVVISDLCRAAPHLPLRNVAEILRDAAQTRRLTEPAMHRDCQSQNGAASGKSGLARPSLVSDCQDTEPLIVAGYIYERRTRESHCAATNSQNDNFNDTEKSQLV